MISCIHLEGLETVPPPLVGLVWPYANAEFGSWVPGHTLDLWVKKRAEIDTLWAGQPEKAWALNANGWGVSRLLVLDDPMSLTTEQEIYDGIMRGVFDYTKLIPQWECVLSGQTRKPKRVYLDDGERQIPPSVLVRLDMSPKRRAEQAWLAAIYNTAVALCRHFGIEPEAVCVASAASVATPWSERVPVLTDHCWYGSSVLTPGAVVNISIGEYGNDLKGAKAITKIIGAINACRKFAGSIEINAYLETDKPYFLSNLNDARVGVVLKNAVGGN